MASGGLTRFRSYGQEHFLKWIYHFAVWLPFALRLKFDSESDDEGHRELDN